METEPSALLDVKQLSAMLCCSPAHIWRLADKGHLPVAIRLGRLVRWARPSIDNWLAGGCKPVRATCSTPKRRHRDT